MEKNTLISSSSSNVGVTSLISSLKIEDCDFKSQTCDTGCFINAASKSKIEIVNSRFEKATADRFGGLIYLSGSELNFTSSTINEV